MKAYKVTIFIFTVIVILGIISYVFSTNKIKIGNISLNFPSFNDIAKKDVNLMQEIKISNISDKIAIESNLLLDSILAIEKNILTNDASFDLPNNDLSFFDTFFKDVSSANQESRLIRVLHYGDSQLEMDRITSTLRNNFQELFGGSGAGLLPLSQAIPSESVFQSISGDYSTYSIYGDNSRCASKEYGPFAKFHSVSGNVIFKASASTSSNTLPILRGFSKITMLYNTNNSLMASLTTKKGHYKLYNTTDKSGKFSSITWNLDTSISSVSLSINGTGNIYGIALDGQSGIAVDNIPIRGSLGTFFSSIDSCSMSAINKLLNVKMILLQFGGNAVPGLSSEKVNLYAKTIANQIRYFHKISPEATIVFIGPSDMSTRCDGKLQTYRCLPALTVALKDSVTNNNAAYWDVYKVMKGENSMINWVKNGLANNDYIHFTSKGAKEIGNALFNSFKIMYDYYCLKEKLLLKSADKN